MQAKETSETERHKYRDHTQKKTCSSELVISERLRLSNLSSKQEPVTKRKIFSFNPPLPVLLFTFQYENCHGMLFLSPVLLPFNINEAAE